MKKKFLALAGYSTFFMFILVTDFLSKQWALQSAQREVVLNRYVSCEVLTNRGISWGLFHHATNPVFIMLSVIISLLVVLLCGYTVFRFMKGFPIFAETLILAGACGNLIDRVLYRGVIDFLVVHAGSIYFPVFNFADAAIVVGVICMVLLTPE